MQITFCVRHGKKPLYEETVIENFIEKLTGVIEMWYSILNDSKGNLVVTIQRNNVPKKRRINGCPEECFRKGHEFIYRHTDMNAMDSVECANM